MEHFLQEKPNDPEARLKAWGMDKVLSGDILVEQGVRSVDVMTWILDNNPISAYGTGGRNWYKHGDIWDCFAITYRFPPNVPASSTPSSSAKGTVTSAVACMASRAPSARITAARFGGRRSPAISI